MERGTGVKESCGFFSPVALLSLTFYCRKQSAPCDVSGGPVSASQPQRPLSASRGAPDGRAQETIRSSGGSWIDLTRAFIVHSSRSLLRSPGPRLSPSTSEIPALSSALTVFPEVPGSGHVVALSADTGRASLRAQPQQGLIPGTHRQRQRPRRRRQRREL